MKSSYKWKKLRLLMSHTFGIMSIYREMNFYHVFFVLLWSMLCIFVLVWCTSASGHKEIDWCLYGFFIHFSCLRLNLPLYLRQGKSEAVKLL